jgi:hypothetical protein
MRHAQTRPDQTTLPNTLTQLVNEALRAAALAPTYIDALDITGRALKSIAELARVELEALLNMCYGAGFEQFNSMAERLQDSALEPAADLAGQINRIADGVEHA